MNILVIVAHPDDEVLGCGATIAKHTAKGDKVDVLIIGDGVTARYEEHELKNPEVIEKSTKVNQDAYTASTVLDINSIQIIGKYGCRFDKYPMIDIAKIIEKKIQTFQPEVIYTHSPYDVNNDHTVVFKAVLAATRPFPNHCVKKIFLMEVLSSTEWNFLGKFRPNVYVDVNGVIDKKVKAIECYKSEIRDFPNPRSGEAIITLAKKRGSEVGLYYAEAFMLLRSIE